MSLCVVSLLHIPNNSTGIFSSLDLADFLRVGEELQIDTLIGSDHYWQLVTGRVVRGESGPTAIHT